MQERKLQVINFSKWCCPNATRKQVVLHSPTDACRGSFGHIITPMLSCDTGGRRSSSLLARLLARLPRQCTCQAINRMSSFYNRGIDEQCLWDGWRKIIRPSPQSFDQRPPAERIVPH